MKIGFDIDGVLADFVSAYQEQFIALTGRNTFAATDRKDPPEWNWPTLRGYTDAETKEVWNRIKSDCTFWLNLQVDPGMPTLRTMIRELEKKHDVYYITSRPGIRAKRQTEIWLTSHLGYNAVSPLLGVFPTVMLAEHRQKGQLARGLGLDVYIDDNFDNANDVGNGSPNTRNYLLNRAYNRLGVGPFTRVDSLGQMFDIEIAAGNL